MILFIAGHQAERQMHRAQAEQIEAVHVQAVRMPTRPLGVPLFTGQFLCALYRNLMLLRAFRVDVVLGMGSFASAPTGLAAVITGRKLFLHEGNTVLGRTNRRLARWADFLLLSFPLRLAPPPTVVQRVVGMPVRDSILQLSNRLSSDSKTSAAPPDDGLQPSRLTLLVFGGSQGSTFINACVTKAVSEIPDPGSRLQIVHLTGAENNNAICEFYAAKGIPHVVKAKDDQIEKYYACAGLVICRSGGATIAEMALLGKTGLFIPLPTAMDNHQRENAALIREVNGGCVIQEHDAASEELSRILVDWMANPTKYHEFGRNLRVLAKPRAAADVVDAILTSVEKGE